MSNLVWGVIVSQFYCWQSKDRCFIQPSWQDSKCSISLPLCLWDIHSVAILNFSKELHNAKWYFTQWTQLLYKEKLIFNFNIQDDVLEQVKWKMTLYALRENVKVLCKNQWSFNGNQFFLIVNNTLQSNILQHIFKRSTGNCLCVCFGSLRLYAETFLYSPHKIFKHFKTALVLTDIRESAFKEIAIKCVNILFTTKASPDVPRNYRSACKGTRNGL